jgi:outer membrane protein OmpA-like peptidoglycan-associated protein
MKNRLYSFEEFLNEAYQIIAEAASWDDGVSPFVSKLSGGADAAKPLARLKSMINSLAAVGLNNPAKVEGNIAEELKKLVDYYNSNNKAQIKSIELALAEIEYKNLMGGKAAYDKNGLPESLIDGIKLKPGKEDISKILLAVSAKNIYDKSNRVIANWGGKRIWDAALSDSEKIESLKDIDETALIKGSGVLNQRIMTASTPTIKFEISNIRAGAIKGIMNIPEGEPQKCLTGGKNASRKEATIAPEATFDLVLYILKEINPNEGIEMPYESLEIEKVPVTTGGEMVPLDIQDNGVLFVVNTTDLTEEGKKYMANLIATKFSSVEKIEVIGGASQEGEKKRNEELCIGRAKSVADFLTKLGYTATASTSTDQIQPEKSTEDRTTWRKVTLNITGKSRPNVIKTTDEKAFYADINYRLDKAVIVQATYTITVAGNF